MRAVCGSATGGEMSERACVSGGIGCVSAGRSPLKDLTLSGYPNTSYNTFVSACPVLG